MTTEEADYITDWMTDALFKLVRKAETEIPERVSKFLLVSFKCLVKWYASPVSKIKCDLLTTDIEYLLVDKPQEFDVLEYTGCPHAETVAKIMDSNSSMRSKLTATEISRWQRVQKREVETYLRSLYELS